MSSSSIFNSRFEQQEQQQKLCLWNTLFGRSKKSDYDIFVKWLNFALFYKMLKAKQREYVAIRIK